MAGRNLALEKNKNLFESNQRLFSSQGEISCVFISYQRNDERFAEAVANYIMKKDVNVYFDLMDGDLQRAKISGISDEVNRCIQKGLSVCKYMLIILSESTMKSVWVPFEIGYGYAQNKDIKILNHKALSNLLIPTYLKALNKISTKKNLDSFLLQNSGSRLRSLTSLLEDSGQSPIDKFLL